VDGEYSHSWLPEPDRRAAGQALAARHTWDTAATAHLELYRSLT
jgi:hypothetical protein